MKLKLTFREFHGTTCSFECPFFHWWMPTKGAALQGFRCAYIQKDLKEFYDGPIRQCYLIEQRSIGDEIKI